MSTSKYGTPCSRYGLGFLLLVSQLIFLSNIITPVYCFAVLPSRTSSTIRCSMAEKSSEPKTDDEEDDDENKNSEKTAEKKTNPDVAKQLERAKAALAISRAKMEAREEAEAGFTETEEIDDKKEEAKILPFFAAAENGKKEKVIKDKNKDGAFTTDGDLMAKLSEGEEWESRPLLEVFQNEKEESPDSMNIDRDIAQSMYNLQKSLRTEDFRKIFDKRNRFIGES
jgi:hypothetical protein